jgi:hypothetical protein
MYAVMKSTRAAARVVGRRMVFPAVVLSRDALKIGRMDEVSQGFFHQTV